MSERPYVAPGTPVDVYICGHWDGYHNGNEPYMSYVGHDGETRRVHIPHGARVTTRPDLVEELEFTVDKTPGPPVEEPKLRTIKDGSGALAFEVAPDRFWFAVNRAVAQSEYAASDGREDGFSYGDLVEWFSPLTAVTDTGEPLDDAHADWLEEQHRIANNEPPEPQIAFSSDPYPEDDPEVQDADDTPPQPGDRVRGVVVGVMQGNDFLISDSGRRFFPSAFDEIRVVARAKPAVPEAVMDREKLVWTFHEGAYRNPIGGVYSSYATLNEDQGPLHAVERGPVIGGSDV